MKLDESASPANAPSLPDQPLIKRVLPRSLLGRSLLIIVMPLVLLQVVSAFVFYENHWRAQTRRLVLAVANEVATVVELVRLFPDASDRAILIPVGHRLDLDISLLPKATLPPAPPSPEGSYREMRLHGYLRARLAEAFHIDLVRPDDSMVIDVQLSDGVLRFVVSDDRLDSVTTYVFVMWMIGTSLLLFGVATIFMRNQVRSVTRLAAAADAFGKGRDMPNFKPEGATEVRRAALAFLRMRDRINRQIVQRTEMLAGVSHDLRTPLTRMKLQLELMGGIDGVADLRDDVAEMEQMLEDYLAFARGEGREPIEPTDIAPLLDEVVGRFRRDGKAVTLKCQRPLVLPLRRNAFSRSVTNLLSNGVRHAEHVQVTATLQGEVVDITIDDDGPGIPEERRELVFKAFYRLDTSRNRRTGGSGLGLTIVRDVVRSLGGEIRLEDSPTGGLRAHLRLPL